MDYSFYYDYVEKYVQLVLDNEGIPEEGECSDLVSPVVNITTPSCMTFYYYSRLMDFEVYTYNRTTTHRLLYISYDAQDEAWHPVRVQLPVGEYGVSFSMWNMLRIKHHAGVDDVTVEPGSCQSQG